MKKILFGLIAMVFSINLGFSNTNLDFPKYSSILYMEDACSCSGMFSSCSGSGNCSCTCGYFSCSCTASEGKLEKALTINISISEDQFKNVEKLAEKLNELKMDKALSFLGNSIENLKEKDVVNFELNRNSFFSELSKMSNKKKQKLNKFFISIGAEERV